MDLTVKDNNIKPIIKKAIIKKNHFFLGKMGTTGVLRILRRKTNIFVIFEDLKKQTIICKTSGAAGIVGSKRRKRIPQAIETIFSVLYPYLKIYSIKLVRIILNSRMNACFYIFLRLLEYYNIRVGQCSVHRKIAFNGCKGRKPRRI